MKSAAEVPRRLHDAFHTCFHRANQHVFWIHLRYLELVLFLDMAWRAEKNNNHDHMRKVEKVKYTNKILIFIQGSVLLGNNHLYD